MDAGCGSLQFNNWSLDRSRALSPNPEFLQLTRQHLGNRTIPVRNKICID